MIYLGRPEVTQLPSSGKPLSFKVEYELRPKLDPIGYMGLEVERPSTQVSAERIDERIEQLREQHATLQPIEGREAIEDGDSVELDFRAVSDEPELEDLHGEDVTIVVGRGQALPGIEQALRGAAFDGTLKTTVELEESFPVETLRGREVELELTIKGVKEQVLPEVDDEFAVDTGMGESVAELRDAIRTQLKHDLEHQAHHIAEDNLIQALLTQNEIDLPPRFVEEQIGQAISSQLQSLSQQGIDPSQIGMDIEAMTEDIRGQRTDQLRAEFVIMAIAEKEGLKVEQSDLTDYFEHQAQHYGVQPRVLAQYMQSDRDRMQQAISSALMEKTVRMLLDKAAITETEWPSDDEDEADEADEAKDTKKASTAKKKPAAKKTTAKKTADEDSAAVEAARGEGGAQEGDRQEGVHGQEEARRQEDDGQEDGRRGGGRQARRQEDGSKKEARRQEDGGQEEARRQEG